ncbi:ImuA family protein [Maricaulis sp.]|uniref:ImuA family protein n=1 Tax=Maricaulis sp. TaxID=1486257 RepID=UPI003A92E0F7
MPTAPRVRTGRPQLEELRRQIQAIETPITGPAPTGQDALVLAPGLHEVCPASYLDTPAALAFQIGMLGGGLSEQAPLRPVIWVRCAGHRAHDFGRPYPLALARWGLAPERVLLVEARDASDVLWAMEEGLNAGALVIGEIGASARYDLTASRRLHRAARAGGARVLVLRGHQHIQPSAALTRWRLSALPSPDRPWRGATGLPGLGAPRFRAVLERVRGGPPKSFEIEWKNAAFHVLEPAEMARRAAPPAPERETVRRLAG